MYRYYFAVVGNTSCMLYAQKKCINHPHHTVNPAVDSIGDMVVIKE